MTERPILFNSEGMMEPGEIKCLQCEIIYNVYNIYKTYRKFKDVINFYIFKSLSSSFTCECGKIISFRFPRNAIPKN